MVPESKKIEKMIAPYKDLIIKTAENAPERGNVINMENLEDLAKTAEILARPIFYKVDGKVHNFYIIEDNTKYEYETSVPVKPKRRKWLPI